jgi:hypothetical protein
MSNSPAPARAGLGAHTVLRGGSFRDTIMQRLIHDSAHKHGVVDTDIHHAIDHALHVEEVDDDKLLAGRIQGPAPAPTETQMIEHSHYGRTRDGVEVTNEMLQALADEAEAGYDPSRMKPRGRPPMGTAPAKAFPVRLDPDLRLALDNRAAQDDKPAAEVVREALRRYLAAS